MAGWHAVLSVALVALATAAVRRVHLRELGRGSTTKTRRFRMPSLPRWRPRLRDAPVLWKEAFAATAKTKLGLIGSAAVVALGLTALGAVVYAFFETIEQIRRGNIFGNRIPYFEFVAVFNIFVSIGLLLLVAARASGLVTVEKERDCWVSLLSTPLTAGEIVRGKTLGNLYAARWGFALLAFAWALGVVFDVRFAFVAVGMGIVFLLCAWFVTNVGLLYSMKSKTSLRALGFTLAVCFFIGGGYLMCCCPIMVATGDPDDGFMLGLAPCMPFLMAFPSLAFGQNIPSSEFNVAGPAFVIGVIGYLIACAVLANYLTGEFDSLAGRTGSVPDGRPA
jgi:ABC-type Na+ efflux pump permease subunit